MKKYAVLIFLMIVSLIFASCGTASVTEDVTAKTPETVTSNEDSFDESLESTEDFTITPGAGAGEVTVDGTTYTITSAGEYTLSGRLDGNIVVDAGDEDEVVLILNNVTISSSDAAPIAFVNAGEGTVKSEEGTYNAIYDERTGDVAEDDSEDEDEDGAIFAACDLKITGNGSLTVTSTYDNGIKTKDDLKIKNVTLKVTSVGNALKGNDSVTVESGSLILISTESDGVKTKNSDVSSKGNQRGDVTVTGGTVEITSAGDGVHAAHDVVISGGDVTITSADDGIHAEGTITISGGAVNIADSHEGLEANVIDIQGGNVFVYGEDDGLNAAKGDSTPLIKISGGFVDITAPSGDTDAADSNGDFTVTGGFVLIKGGAAMGSVAGSVDVDGEISVTGGTVIALGGICEVPASGSVNYYVSSGTTFGAGEYVLSSSDGNIATFTLTSSYASLWIASDALTLDGEYTLTKDGEAILSWTQSSSASGDSVQSGFGGMGRR